MRKAPTLIAQAICRFGWPSILVVGGRLSFLLLFLVAARTAAPSEFGLFVVAVAASQILANVCSLGTAPAAMQIVSAERRPGKIWAYIRFSTIVTVAAGLALAALLLGLGALLSAVLPQSDAGRICMAVALLAPVMGLSLLRENLARALDSVALAFIPRDLAWTLSLSLLLAFSPAIATNLTLAAAASLLAVELLSSWLLWRGRIAAIAAAAPTVPLRAYRRWVQRSLAMMSNYVASLGFDRIDVLIVGLFLSLPVAGIYGAASRLASLLSLPQRFVIPMVSPKIAQGLATRNGPLVWTEVRLALLASLAVSVPALIGVLLWAGEIMRLYGPEFASGAGILRILAFAHLAVAACAAFSAVILMGPSHWLFTRIIWSALIPVTVALLAVVPIAGPEAAAAIVAAGIILYNLSLVWLALRALKRLKPRWRLPARFQSTTDRI